MSVHVTQAVWKLSKARGNDRLVLLALADNADEDEQLAWPSVETLAAKTAVSRRTVQRSLSKLVEIGEIEVAQEGGRLGGRGLSTTYRVLVGKGANLTQFAERASNRASKGVIGDTPTVREPTTNGSREMPEQGVFVGLPKPSGSQGGYPPAVKEALPFVVKRLSVVAASKGCSPPRVEPVAKAMAAFPDRDFKRVVDELEFWALHGNGQRRKIKSLAGTWRTFLSHADPAPQGQRYGSVDREGRKSTWDDLIEDPAAEELARGDGP